MIIAVNICESLALNAPVIDCTREAWGVTIKRCQEHDFVIGVCRGNILGYFVRGEVTLHPDDRSRVVFDLKPCTQQQIAQIDQYIAQNNINLKGFVTKFI